MQTRIIKTPCGLVEGSVDQKVSFKGVRYAYAERFCPPVAVTSWNGIYDATSFKAVPIQNRAFIDEATLKEKAFYYQEFRQGLNFEYSEDCLFLNIHTPISANPASKLAVIFYIHGGVYYGGSGQDKPFNEPHWHEENVIAVTINYRLGPLGFAFHPDMKSSGNLALLDQICALKWIRDNIEAFGGNSQNITIMGQSAGAVSVRILCSSPLSKGLFSKAVISSGPSISKRLDKTDLSQYWLDLQKSCNCKSLEELKKVDASVLYTSWLRDMKAFPAVDDRVIAANPKERKPCDIPYLIGYNSNDILVDEMKEGIKVLKSEASSPVYDYFFNHHLPGDNMGAWHSADLWYWFGCLEQSWRPFTKDDWDLSKRMIKILCDFAKTAKPNLKPGVTAYFD